MANWYVSSVGWAAVTQFQISHAYSVGDIIRQLATPTVGQERVWRCTTAGTSAGSEPSPWTLTKASTTTSGSAVFTEITGNETWQAAGAWAAPFARIISAGASGWAVAGDNIYVAANHAETVGASVAWSIQSANAASAQTSIVCVDHSGSGHVPPSAGDIRATATFTVTGNFAFTLTAGNLYVYGIIFNLQSGGSNNQANTIASGTNGGMQKFEACAFNLLSSSNSSLTLNVAAGGSVEWINTTYQLGNTAVVFAVRCRFVWRDTASAVSGSVQATSLMIDSGAPGNIYIDGVDLSGAGATKIAALSLPGSRALVVNCKLHASVVAPTLGANSQSDTRIDFMACDSGAVTVRCESYTGDMNLTTETALIHTGGASDGTTGYSWKCATSTSVKFAQPAPAFPIAIWNGTTGGSKTVSFEAIINAAAVLNNDGLWMEVHYLGTSSSALASLATSSKTDILQSGSPITASSAAWDSLLTARANSHVYSIGDIIAVSSNSGRAFFCTTGGTSSGSLPVGYATCIDGGSVTDGSAIFRAGCRMTISKAVTPQTAGLIRVTPKLGVISTTVYIDPLLTVA